MQQNLQDRLKQLVLALNWRMTNDTETRRKDFVLTWGGLALMLLALAYAIDPLKRFLHPPLFLRQLSFSGSRRGDFMLVTSAVEYGGWSSRSQWA